MTGQEIESRRLAIAEAMAVRFALIDQHFDGVADVAADVEALLQEACELSNQLVPRPLSIRGTAFSVPVVVRPAIVARLAKVLRARGGSPMVDPEQPLAVVGASDLKALRFEIDAYKQRMRRISAGG